MLDKATILKRANAIVILIALCVLLLAASKGYFRADDFAHLRVNRFEVVRDLATIIAESEFTGHYRPMVKVFFWSNNLVFGLEPLGYFIVLIAIFLLTLYMFFLLVKILSGNILYAYSAVLLLLLQANSYIYTVNWIGAATDILSGFFSITTLYFYTGRSQFSPESDFYVESTATVRRARLYYLLSLISFGLGLLSREIAVVLIPMLLAYDFLFLWLETPEKKEFLRNRFSSHVPFWLLLIVYVLVRNAITGTLAYSGGSSYTFVLGPDVLNNLIFYGMQLGFLPIAVLFLSIVSLGFGRLRFEKRELKLVAMGTFLAMCAILPFLFFRWSSPTWMYLPAFGTTLAFSVLFQRGLSDSSGEKRALLFYGTLICALIGNILLFSKLSEARWWQWGTYSRNVIEQVEARYPNLPSGAKVYFIDKNEQEPYGIEGLFRFRSYLADAFRVWYNDPSLYAFIVDKVSSIEATVGEKGDEGISTIFVFEYDEGLISDKTNWFRELRTSKTSTPDTRR